MAFHSSRRPESMDMEPTLFITLAVVSTIGSSTQENVTAPFNETSLGNFNEMIDRLIAENEAAEKSNNGREPTLAKENEVLKNDKNLDTNNSQPNLVTNDDNSNIIRVKPLTSRSGKDVSAEKEFKNDENLNSDNKNDLNLDNEISKLLNPIINANVTIEDTDFDTIANNLSELLNLRNGKVEKEDNYFKPTRKVTQGNNNMGMIVEEELVFEVEDSKPKKSYPSVGERFTFDTSGVNIPPLVPYRGSTNNLAIAPSQFIPSQQTLMKTNIMETNKTAPTELPEIKKLIPEPDENDSRLLKEINKMNKKIHSVEKLIQKSIANQSISEEVESPTFRKISKKPVLITSKSGCCDSAVPTPPATYHRALSDIIAAPLLTLQQGLLKEKTKNRLLLYKLEKVARARQNNIALLNRLANSRSRLVLHVPRIYQPVLV